MSQQCSAYQGVNDLCSTWLKLKLRRAQIVSTGREDEWMISTVLSMWNHCWNHWWKIMRLHNVAHLFPGKIMTCIDMSTFRLRRQFPEVATQRPSLPMIIPGKAQLFQESAQCSAVLSVSDSDDELLRSYDANLCTFIIASKSKWIVNNLPRSYTEVHLIIV